MKQQRNIFVLKVYVDFAYMIADMGRYPALISCTLKRPQKSKIISRRRTGYMTEFGKVP
jgi:hypothetical protein